jgi:hypothetical protein
MSEPESAPRQLDEGECRLDGAACNRAVAACIALGLLLLSGGWLAAGSSARFLQSYYVAYCFCLSLSLGALFFVLLHHLVGATWSVVVRRVAEACAVNIILLVVLLLPLLAGHVLPYQSLHEHAVGEAGHLPATRAAFLHRDFYLARCVLYFVAWTVMALVFWARSTVQDATGDAALTVRNRRWSGPGMVLFAFTVAFGGIDLLMALNPRWHSTMFGVYFFSGCALGFFALLPLAVLALQATGRLRSIVTAEHFHDMGKLLFAFVFFWAYIAFSQYMLIWYADMPEETHWFLKRASPEAGFWNAVSLALLFGHWLIPFVALLSRETKRRRALLAVWCAWLLALHYADLYWLTMPEWHAGGPLGWLSDAACLLGLSAWYAGGALLLLRRSALVPLKDPDLQESLALENY